MYNFFLFLPFFIATFISAIYLRKTEMISATVLVIILLIILGLSKFSFKSSIAIVFIGFIMAFAEWICITRFNMWKYNYSQYQIPVWLPFAWSISIIFAYYIIEMSQK